MLRPDITEMVDWALKTNYLPTYLVCLFVCLFVCACVRPKEQEKEEEEQEEEEKRTTMKKKKHRRSTSSAAAVGWIDSSRTAIIFEARRLNKRMGWL